MLNERERELCFEGKRWFDLMRYCYRHMTGVNINQKLADVEEISIYDAHKRVLAEDIMAFHDSPPFDKSAMDGFAIIGENTFGASQSAPKEFKIIDAIGAGDFSDKTVGENEAIVIATGAPIPAGADAVIMKEYTTTDGDDLTIYSQVTPGENVSPKSEDIKKGQKILLMIPESARFSYCYAMLTVC